MAIINTISSEWTSVVKAPRIRPVQCSDDEPDVDKLSLQDAKSDDDESDSDADSECPDDWQTRQYNVVLNFRAKNYLIRDDDLRWCGRMEIRTKNVARLLKQGLHWTLANIQRRKGHYILDPLVNKGIPRLRPWKYGRSWSLVELDDEGKKKKKDPLWVAEFIIMADEISLLSEFNLDTLCTKNIQSAYAFNRRQNLVYLFDRGRPSDNFNAIYDNMPLEGWWPWPKKESGEPSIIDVSLAGTPGMFTISKDEIVGDVCIVM
ncbi:hypothetical protein PT974_09686 [Cladobotryum mycophilum]|uniref:Uncharacterized protein n=1 Tax=Cladobotryum mycophilum TaxID=491253 RepID=A0ABR0SGZ3_9HYPO